MTLSITFLLPRTGEIPIGGFKVVYEYANRLVNDGYLVNIVYGIVSRPVKNPIINAIYYSIRVFRWIKYKIFICYKPSKWFITDKRINHILKYTLLEKGMPKTDCYIATAWSTAIWLNKYKCIDVSKKYYLIQNFEDWNCPYEVVIQTWKMPLNKIVIAPWLKMIADELNEKSYLIENGFDTSAFYIKIPINEKNKFYAVMLWHDDTFKGCGVGLQSLKLVKKIFPEFKVKFFGVPKKPKNLPDWIEYYQNPNQETLLYIYNSCAIFVGPSNREGFCLTPPEAMLCGCAVACTNIGGYTVVAHDNETALISEPGDVNSLYENIIKLINDDNLRFRIAINGNKLIKSFTWDRAYKKFMSVINNNSI